MSKKRKKLLLAGIFVVVVLMGAAIAFLVSANTIKRVTGLDNPYVVFNFSPERMKKLGDADWSQSMYRYDLSGGTVQDVLPHNGIYYSDLDSDTGMLIGREGDRVVETSITEGTKRPLGPGSYNGEPLVDSTIRWRPNSRDYSALTESGVLVLYRQEPGRFEVLADMSNVWNGYCFGGSWVDDGETLSVPDETGIALLDIASKKLEHWVTLPITYSPKSTADFHDNRTAFEVSNERTLIVYCDGDMLKTAAIDSAGKMEESVMLEEHAGYDRSFAIASDGETVIFVIGTIKRTLFTPYYYKIKIRQNGVATTLVEAFPLPNQCMTVFW